MGKGSIYFEQIEHNSKYYYYRVTSHIGGENNFYVKIDSQNKKIFFSSDEKYQKLIGIIDFNIPDCLIDVSDIDRFVSTRSAMITYKWILENKFPKNFVWAA